MTKRPLIWTAIVTVLVVATARNTGGAREIQFPAPAVDAELSAERSQESIVVAGGCFWGVQAVFQHVKGVEAATSGYAGGSAKTARYEVVSSGTTGHAESVRVVFDPSRVTLGQLLKIFFAVVHDPTELNRQGPDEGTQYRSAIFYNGDAQKQIATAYVAQLNDAKIFKRPIVTQIAPLDGFFAAEAYHQDYFAKNPFDPYIVINDRPKVENLRKLFAGSYVKQAAGWK